MLQLQVRRSFPARPTSFPRYGPQNRPSDVDLKARNTGLLKDADPKKNCPRCQGSVFSNEEIRAKNNSYHKR